MNDYMRALHQRFFREPAYTDVREKIAELRRELRVRLDRQDREKLLKLADLGIELREETSLASFMAGFKLAWGLARKLEADGLYFFEDEEEARARRRESGRWNGRFVVGYKESSGSIFRYVSGDTQKEMLDKLHRDMDAYRGADLTKGNQMTLAQWLDRWLETYTAGTMRESARRSYRTYVERYIHPRLGDRIISPRTSRSSTRLSRTMVRRIHAMLHSTLKAVAMIREVQAEMAAAKEHLATPEP